MFSPAVLPTHAQETADGELIVLHDFHLGDAFPNAGPNTQPYRQLQQQLGLKQDRVMHLLVKVCLLSVELWASRLRQQLLRGLGGLL